MTWMCWRQFRAQAGWVGLALAGAAALLGHLGLVVRADQRAYLAHCRPGGCADAAARFVAAYENTFLLLAAGIHLVPVVIGMFWGAPLIGGELESGTHRLVWNQGVTRAQWLRAKLVFVGVATTAVAGLAAIMLTWAAAPVDHAAGDRFAAITFGARDLVPVAVSALAFVIGTAAGLLLRRRVPAMAVVGVLVIALEIAVPRVVRPHFIPPDTARVEMTADAINGLRSLGSITGRPVVGGLTVPDAWVSRTSPLLTRTGNELDEDVFNRCLTYPPRTGAGGTFGDTAVCLGRLGLHVDVEYQPDSRYWAFQVLESTLYVTVGLVLLAFCFWRIRRPIG